MSNDRTIDEGKATPRRRGAPRPPAEADAGYLERLAADLVRQLGPQKARLLAALIDEAVDAAEAGG
jgi:hypothetical protein